MTPGSASAHPTLRRSLGLWAIVGLGLGYMTPMTVFDTFGYVSEASGGVVPLAYVFALVVMLFTAISYGRMTRVYPSAGSAYTYASETIHPNVGFLVGWTALLDYLLLPLVNALLVRQYLESFFPDVPSWIWVVVYVAAITLLNLWSISSTSKVNATLLIFQIVLIGVFIVLAWSALTQGAGNGTPFSLAPFWQTSVQVMAVVGAATIVCFSFIGFDAITMYTEEARDTHVVPKAIVLALLLGGAIFFVAAWFTQSLFPVDAGFEGTALPEIANSVGGIVFQIFFVSAAVAAAVASSLASHASVSRMLYVMGRNGTGPVGRLFSFVHPTFRTPSVAVIFVGIVSLGAAFADLDFIFSLINFGALIAFTVVNVTVIVHFAVRRREVRSAGDIIRNIVLPVIGVALTLLLWVNLATDAMTYGAIWLVAGVVVLLALTRFFRRNLRMSFEEDAVISEGEEGAAAVLDPADHRAGEPTHRGS
ncbi:APC family permease [Microbacterium hydrocarbonoxydans]|uniref:APC family permease n=1 Tax=Microbacterium hydrocarbonoxydans TaxID=273678 RepID=UPI0007BB8449|nr:APC family permease [Microbacterium hydrocarbonoxydans]GAT74006.1 amino acid permease-associated protein [Microbacterium sp. HM58-2]